MVSRDLNKMEETPASVVGSRAVSLCSTAVLEYNIVEMFCCNSYREQDRWSTTNRRLISVTFIKT